MAKNPKFQELLLARKIVSEQSLTELMDRYKGNSSAILKQLVGDLPVKKGLLGRAWGDSIQVAYVDISKTVIHAEVLDKLPADFARKNLILPLYELNGVTTIAAAFPEDTFIMAEVKAILGGEVSAVFSFPEDILDAIELHYQSRNTLRHLVGRAADSSVLDQTHPITTTQLSKAYGESGILELSRTLMFLAAKERASDIHIDPQEHLVYVRFRIDGVLRDRLRLENDVHRPLISRLKVVARLDITEARRPQDGRISLSLAKKSLEFRVSTLPTIYGEKMVLRLLGDAEKEEIPELTDLHFSKSNLRQIRSTIDRSNGIFFVTGPTGSGKSTTLFSVLNHLNQIGINILTAEDPVEYRLPRVNQVQVNQAIGFGFANVLRTFLRQDPDVILIGEIRDLETAKIAAEAALTGHLVLSSMHTNDSLQTISRLIELGVEPFLVAPSIIAVLAQRLVRRLCEDCKEEFEPSRELMDRYFEWDGKTEVRMFRATGCPRCDNIGYRGRLAIHEVFTINEELRGLISKGASVLEIRTTAVKSGFKCMRYDAMLKILMGLTTIEELERVTAETL